MDSVENVRRHILSIIESLPQLERSEFFPAVQIFIEATEFYLAFEDILGIIVVERIPVPPRTAELIREYYMDDGMEDDSLVVDYLSSAIFLAQAMPEQPK